MSPFRTGDISSETAADLYGAPSALEVMELAAGSGAGPGRIRLISGAKPAQEQQIGGGGYAVDLYTRDTDATRRQLGDQPAHRSATYQVGTLQLQELLVRDGAGTSLVLIESSKRRPSLLDHHPHLRYSEVSAYVFLIRITQDEVDFWTGAGLEILRDDVLRSPQIARLMRLPRPDTPLRMMLLHTPGSPGPRLELLEPLDPDLELAPRPDGVAGLQTVCYEVDDLNSALAGFGRPARPTHKVLGERVARTSSPAGIGITLTQARAVTA